MDTEDDDSLKSTSIIGKEDAGEPEVMTINKSKDDEVESDEEDEDYSLSQSKKLKMNGSVRQSTPARVYSYKVN